MFEDIQKKMHEGKHICMFYHAKDSCKKVDNCDYSHAPELKLTDKQKKVCANEMERRRKIRLWKQDLSGKLRQAQEGKGRKKGKGKGSGDGKGKSKSGKGKTPDEKKKIQCFFETQPGGCKKGTECPYKHTGATQS